ncbi:hypothetical protein ACFJIX_25430 [Roseateles sp. UC29_93]|uniref:hypothetical protein n=1 Tax=Roseateles sp. UC29_93 TaxID=3350177 RepID=UPI003672901F
MTCLTDAELPPLPALDDRPRRAIEVLIPAASTAASRCHVLNRKLTTRAAFDGICDRIHLLQHHVEVMRADDSAARLAHDHAVMGQVLDELDVLLRVIALAGFEEQLYRWAMPQRDLKS